MRQRVIVAAVSLFSLAGVPALAQTGPGSESGRSVNQWLTRMHEASRQRAYTGTLVVSTGSAMSASRVWHVCDGTQQMERIETLTGAPRTTIRHNSDVITFVPEDKTAWVEKRDSLGLFPELLRTPANQIPEFYGVRERGVERVAGYLSDVVEIVPKDSLRFGYRVWSEKHSGLVMKLQTVDARGQVLEQLAFTELQMNAPVRMKKLARLMKDTRGYEVHHAVLNKTTLEAEGWRMKDVAPGFLLVKCHTREPGPVAPQGPHAMQCVYSDGLATVSLFVEPQDGTSGQADAGLGVVGATHSMTRYVGPFRITALGEVPPLALGQFAQAIERLP
ncbi:MucB/RseB C-terminal domain-containing protein [Hydrogenophaga crassostreae]|uniref:MucB/RseB C-terminal domain-containing protein n=1 Tax=Hydrogenophaga crassostreae TaxID=1763535 RepID=UPI0038B27FA6